MFFASCGRMCDCSRTEGCTVSWVMSSVTVGSVRWMVFASLYTPVRGLVQMMGKDKHGEKGGRTCAGAAVPTA